MYRKNDWDVVIRRTEPHGRWWWNAWHDSTAIERSGTAATRDAAQRAADAATGVHTALATVVELDERRERRGRRREGVVATVVGG